MEVMIWLAIVVMMSGAALIFLSGMSATPNPKKKSNPTPIETPTVYEPYRISDDGIVDMVPTDYKYRL